jgi:predicted NAD-dependent protein-ADP-ribosyltransferase YbiA (DUF1768 family)
MRVTIKQGLIVIYADMADDDAAMTALREAADGHVFHLARSGPQGVVLRDLGPREDACQEPINITSRIPDDELKLISNFAHAPFELDRRAYASVEGFWQGLKFPKENDRARVAKLFGGEARRAGEAAPADDPFLYEGRSIRVGRPEHWQLMHHACAAKFTQHAPAQAALLRTGTRPLSHRMRRDSQTIPGVIMADIWMAVRANLRDRLREPETGDYSAFRQ